MYFYFSDAEEDVFNIDKYNIGNIPPKLERINIYEYREVHSVPYRVIYQILNDNIYVHCILDAGRDIKSPLTERPLK